MAAPKTPKCTVCTRADMQAIDEGLAAGLSDNALARQFGITRDSIRRHRVNHLTPALRRAAQQRRTASSTESALDRLEGLYERTGRLLDRIERADGNPNTLIKAIKEARETLQVIARITGELDDSAKVQMIGITASPEWLVAREAMLRALLPYPEAAQAVAASVAQIEAVTE